MERQITDAVCVQATREEVWEAWTTAEGVATFFAPDANIQLSPGGAYEMYFRPEAEEGARGGEGVTVLSFVPGEMLSFTWNAPPEFPEVRQHPTWVVLYIDEIIEGSVDITLQHLGWREGEQWDQVFEYFKRAWRIVLGRLQYRFEIGPIDWEAPYTPELID